ncbi:hypothetical protein KSP39_PZI022559 [Platanthera zijinensis]|uniref:Carotenoid cleavage dioxygenase 4 n=1 Tax=Platanthera zijinensis TaxID=2320716 RepID=A0AAP0AV67_9ASPA
MAASFSTSGTHFFPATGRRWGTVISPVKNPLPRPPLLVISAVQAQEKPQQRPAVTKDQQPPNVESSSSRQALPSVQAQPRRSQPSYQEPSVAAAFCNALDDLINNFIDPPLFRPSVDPRHVLSDNWSPVEDLPPTTNCPVIRGAIPACLGGGAYIRNGPNPQHLPRGPHHLFDGDGMLHSLLLPRGGGTAPATLCSRYVHTYKYLLERDAGAPVLPNVFSGFHGPAGIARGAVAAARILTGQMNPAGGVGLANTSLAFFGGRLYALGESDLPYAIRLSGDGDITTLGRCDFKGRVSMGMTAHPKKDPATGETFAFRYGPVPPFLTYFRFDAAGNKVGEDVPVFSMNQPSMLHDFAITERFAVFPDIQIVMKPMDMVAGGGSPVGSDRGKIPRLGVLPKYARSEAGMRWFEVPGFNIMHAVNAWEEESPGGDGDGEIVLVAPNVLSVEHALDRMELVHSSVEMVRIDLGSGAVSRTPLSAENLDFGVIHPGYVGRKNRFAYLGAGNPMPKISGVRKLDFSLCGRGDCVVAARDFGPGCFGGEPFFVPAGGDAAGRGEEDEGYIVSYLHDEGNGKSKFIVMDSRSPELDVVAEVLLPSRVPYGFHGLFLSAADIRAQRR